MNLSIFDGTLGDLEFDWCGHDGQLPCPDSGPPMLTALPHAPASFAGFTFVGTRDGFATYRNAKGECFQMEDGVLVLTSCPSVNSPAQNPTANSMSFTQWIEANQTMVIVGGVGLVVLLLLLRK